MGATYENDSHDESNKERCSAIRHFIPLLETEVWTEVMTEMIIHNDAILLADDSQLT